MKCQIFCCITKNSRFLFVSKEKQDKFWLLKRHCNLLFHVEENVQFGVDFIVTLKYLRIFLITGRIKRVYIRHVNTANDEWKNRLAFVCGFCTCIFFYFPHRVWSDLLSMRFGPAFSNIHKNGNGFVRNLTDESYL